MEHQQAARMPALQHFISVFERGSEMFADISSGAVLRRKHFVQDV
jgi:hypothetical protein